MWTVSAIQMHPKGLIVCDEDATLELHVKVRTPASPLFPSSLSLVIHTHKRNTTKKTYKIILFRR